MFLNFSVSNEVLIDMAISIGIFVLFLIIGWIFTKYVFSLIIKFSKKMPTEIITHILVSFKKPVRLLFIILGFYVAVGYFPFLEQANPLLLKLVRSSVILAITWGLFNLSSASSLLFTKIDEKYNVKIDQILIPFLSKALRFVIVAISFSIIAQEFDYDVNGFVAGLGLGGLAFALAAKDAIANLFGGIIIITEKPFSIGDWILTPSVEGTVEDISFRSTKIRTFAQAVVTVPNSTLANETITNWSKMGKRQITFNLGVTYDTPKHKLEKVITRIDYLLRNHKEVHPETIFVRFNHFNDSSLDIFLYFFTNTTDWGEYLQIKEEINFKIIEILENEAVSIAFPSRTLYVTSPHAETESMSQVAATTNPYDKK